MTGHAERRHRKRAREQRRIRRDVEGRGPDVVIFDEASPTTYDVAVELEISKANREKMVDAVQRVLGGLADVAATKNGIKVAMDVQAFSDGQAREKALYLLRRRITSDPRKIVRWTGIPPSDVEVKARG